MKLLKQNNHFVIGIIIGLIITATSVCASNLSFQSSEIYYDNTKSGLSYDNVQVAIDELQYRSLFAPIGRIKDNNVYFAYGTPTTASKTDYTKLMYKVFIALNGDIKSLCIVRNNKLYCFDANNYSIEKEHVKQVFSDVTCTTTETDTDCYASDFSCRMNSDGSMYCYDYTNSNRCNLYNDGSVYCYSF